jgi:bacterioferritin-associated ferredoxin
MDDIATPDQRMFVCLCSAITDRQIHDAVDRGVQDVSQLEELWGVGAGCGTCREFAQELIDTRLAESSAYAA